MSTASCCRSWPSLAPAPRAWPAAVRRCGWWLLWVQTPTIRCCAGAWMPRASPWAAVRRAGRHAGRRSAAAHGADGCAVDADDPMAPSSARGRPSRPSIGRRRSPNAVPLPPDTGCPLGGEAAPRWAAVHAAWSVVPSGTSTTADAANGSNVADENPSQAVQEQQVPPLEVARLPSSTDGSCSSASSASKAMECHSLPSPAPSTATAAEPRWLPAACCRDGAVKTACASADRRLARASTSPASSTSFTLSCPPARLGCWCTART
jgi:hypothetical protein